MSPDESVSQWLGRLQDGDPAAAQQLWERYFQRLVGLARSFPQLLDRDNLWRLLVTITARKAYQLVLREGRQKRGGNAILDEAALARLADSACREVGLEQLIDREPTPEFAAQLAEEYERLLASLPDAELRSVAQWKLEGYTNEEIGAKLGCALRSVERKLKVIRSLWDHAEGPR